jgi:hypothetical protein
VFFLATLIQIRRDSQANWTTNDPVLALGEMAYSTDVKKLKVGNGSSNWSELEYINVLPSELDTDNISEGTINLFFTEQRAIDAVAGGEGFTTDLVEEGTTNLYFTAQRAVDAVTQGDVDTDDIEEGTTNLYYTDARVEDVISASDTDDISEGTQNLYFTESRSRSSISGSTGIIYSSTDGVIYVDTDEISTVAYVNATAEGLHVHTAVAVATVENITLSPAPSAIDGVNLTVGIRVLVKDQTTKSENGIYVLDENDDLVRAEDHDTAEKVRPGDFVFVSGGTAQSATGWVQTNEVSTLGTDPIEWTQFIGAGVFSAGTGLDLTGNIFSLDATTDLISEGTSNLYYTNSRVQEATPGRITSSLTKPSDPAVGDGWLDLASGFLYVYVNDGDSSQWIQV